MLYRALIAAFVIALGGLFIGGCAKTTCEKICDYNERCGGYSCSDSDIDDCIDDYKDQDAPCKTALRKMARCLDKSSCTEVEDGECDGEADDVFDECPDFY